MKPAVVLLSGGMDSATTLAVAKNEGFDIYALSFYYGQRHTIELDAARRCSDQFRVKKHLIINFDLREIGGSALTSETEIPKDSNELKVTINRVKNKKSNKPSPVTRHPSLVPVTYVPARNTIFLSFALAWAETIGAEDIYIGANAVDYSGYPDCRPEFLSAFEHLANLATKASVEGKARFNIRAPLIGLTKGDIIRKGIESGVDYSMTWSCYDPQPAKERVRGQGSGVSSMDQPPIPNSQSLIFYVPCRRCDSCLLRAKGFHEAGVIDPLLLI